MTFVPLVAGIVQFISGCPETSRHKILSIMHHTSNRHEFSELTKFSKCEHGDLGEVKRPWIGKNAPVKPKMGHAICGENNKNLEDLKYLTGKDRLALTCFD